MSHAVVVGPDPMTILRSALNAGLINSDEFEEKRAKIGLQPQGGALPTATGVFVSTSVRPAVLKKSGWTTLFTHTSYSDALSAMKADACGPVKWAHNSGRTGDRRFVCCAHVDCAVEYRIYAAKQDLTHLIQVYSSIPHAPVLAEKRRRNSVLTFKQEPVGLRMLAKGTYQLSITHVSCMYHFCIIHVSHTVS